MQKLVALLLATLLNCQYSHPRILHQKPQHGPLAPTISPKSLYQVSQWIGERVLLDCDVDNLKVNTSKSRLIWTKDARLIRPDGIHYNVFPNGSLTIRHASLADSGSYRCLLVRTPSHQGGYHSTHPRQGGIIVGLQRPIPPGKFLNGTKLKILADELEGNALQFKTKPPATISAHLGGSAEMVCEARLVKAPDASLSRHVLETWSRFNRPIQSSRRIQLLDSGRLLSIRNVRPEDAGDYVCVAASTTGQVIAATTTLLIVPKPPEQVHVPEGGRVDFDCSVAPTSRDKDIDGVSSIEWAKDGLLISKLPVGWTLSKDFSMLRIQDTLPNDAGVYECSIRNRLNEVIGEYRWRLSISPGQKPRFTRRPSDQLHLLVSETLIAHCEADGVPKPLINWFRSGDTNENSLNDDPRVTFSPQSGKLEIRNLQQSDSGTYTCTAFNDLDEEFTHMRIIVRPPLPARTGQGEYNLQESNIPEPTPAFVESRPQSLFSYREDDSDDADRSFEIGPEGNAVPSNPVPPPVEFKSPYEVFSPRQIEPHVKTQTRPIQQQRQIHPLPPPRPEFDVQPVELHDSDIISVVNKVRNEIEDARKSTDRHFADPNRHITPQDLQFQNRRPDEQGRVLSEASEIYERSLALIEDQLEAGAFHYANEDEVFQKEIGTQFLTQDHLRLIANLSGCLPHRQHLKIKCGGEDACFHSKYRTIDGTCNNMDSPTWGASHMPFTRILPPRYENGLGEPVGWNEGRLYNGYELPSPRAVSTRLMGVKQIANHDKFTHMLMQWGQFVDHDITFTPMVASNFAYASGRRCNETCHNESPCFPVQIPQGDDRIRRHRCMGTTRSAATCGTGSTSLLVNYVYPREQFNQLTSYLDASAVYGSTKDVVHQLRDRVNTGYLMKVGAKSRYGDQYLLPFAPQDEMDCQIDQSRNNVPCFLAGDHRANEQLGLLSMHTIWVREHNRISTYVHEINPEWKPEQIFQETRKIIGAVFQHLTYQHWLPKILGPTGMALLGQYQGYNSSMQADIFNEFATAAFRFGHTLVMPTIFRFDENLLPLRSGHLPLHEAFFAPYRIIDDEGGTDAIIRGLFAQAAKHFEPGQVMNEELTERLFALAHSLALDLGSLNIQRGRDHAIHPYTAYREWCGFGRAQSWGDLSGHILNEQVLATLQDLYGHPDNVDLFVGLVSEDSVEGSLLGPTLMCLIVDQFKRIRDGDRFWYERPGVFTELQLHQIRKSNLAKVICDTSDNITRVQTDVFLLPSSRAEYVKCDDIEGIDLDYWRDCCYSEGKCVGKSELETVQSIIATQRRLATVGRFRHYSGSLLRSSAELHRYSNDTMNYEMEKSQKKKTKMDKNKTSTVKMQNSECDHDGALEAIAQLKAELDTLRREVAEFKARIRYRSAHRTVINYSQIDNKRDKNGGNLFGKKLRLS